jgi:hypothetical protein
MVNGFYDTSKIKGKKKLKEFFTTVMFHSYNVIVETKYNNDNKQYGRRELNIRYTPEKIIKIGGKLNVINRDLYYQGKIEDSKYGEISLVTDNWEFIYCYLSLEELDFIINKYDLKLINWQ